jgi:Bacterial Ig-like domain
MKAHKAAGRRFARFLAVGGFLVCWFEAQAQTVILSSTPTNGATGVATTTTIRFTFSAAMDTNATSAVFYDAGFNFFDTTPAWSAGDTVLTCTPLAPFPSNVVINWAVSGADTNGGSLGGSPIGSFRTGTGGGGGSGTNAITTFSVGKVHHYNQTSAGAPTLDPTTPYGLSAVTSLASNRTATSVTLTFPTAAVTNLIQLPPPSAEIFLIGPIYTSLTNFDAAVPPGNYTFLVEGTPSNQTVMVNLPDETNQPQPGAPHLANYPATQTVDPSQPFILSWDAFPGGTAADYIDVDIGTNFLSPEPRTPGALSGTAVSITIPSGTLLPDAAYPSRVGFFRFVGTTNGNYETAAYRATYTEFTLLTTGTGLLILTNAGYAAGAFSFDVLSSNAPSVTVEYRTNVATGTWQTLLTTNSPGSQFRAVAPQAATNDTLFFRARTGP